MSIVRRNVALTVFVMDALFLCFVLFAVPSVPYALIGCVFCVASIALLSRLIKISAQLAPWFLGASVLCGLAGVIDRASTDLHYRLFFIVAMIIIISLHIWLTAKLAIAKNNDDK